MEIRNPSNFELERIIEQLNDEFIVSKGKHLHISKRYPFLYNNLEHLWGLFDKNELLAFIAVKPVKLVAEQCDYHLFFIGSVFTPQKHRGNGYAKHLLDETQTTYFANGFNAGVLWTNLVEFYSKLGWVSHENGIFVKGKHLNLKTPLIAQKFEIKTIKSTDFKEIDKFRIDNLTSYIVRYENGNYSGYSTVYSPGENVLRLKILMNGRLIGYVTGVTNSEFIILYECILEKQQSIYDIFAFLKKEYEYSTYFFNLSSSNNIVDLLKEVFGEIEINYPKITMYLYKDISIFKKVSEFYIPFSDRI